MPIHDLVRDSNRLGVSPKEALERRKKELGTWLRVSLFYDVTQPTVIAWQKLNNEQDVTETKNAHESS